MTTGSNRPASNGRRDGCGTSHTANACPETAAPLFRLASKGRDSRGSSSPAVAAKVFPTAGHQIADELVPWSRRRDAVADPAVKDFDPFGVQDFFFGAQNVRPLQRPEIGELRSRQQLIDQP